MNRSAGMVAGLIGCVLGVLGILTFGVIFVPLAFLCGLIGFVRGCRSGGGTGTGVSLLAMILAFCGFTVSPSLWLTSGIVLGALSLGSTSASPPAKLATLTPQQVEMDRRAATAQGLNTFGGELRRFIDQTTLLLEKTAFAEKRVMQTTHEMEAMLNRANAASRAHPSTGVRGEFLSRSSGFKASAQRIEREAEQALIAFDLARETLAARASKPVATCKALVTSIEAPSTGGERIATECGRLSGLFQQSQSLSAQQYRAFDALERTIKVERSKKNAIETRSSTLH